MGAGPPFCLTFVTSCRCKLNALLGICVLSNQRYASAHPCGSRQLSGALQLVVWAVMSVLSFGICVPAMASFPGITKPTRTIEVSNDVQLSRAIKDLQAGDHVILADGQYRGQQLKDVRGTASQPIIISAQNKHQSVLSGSYSGANMRVLGARHIDFYGLRFSQGTTWGVRVGVDSSNSHDNGACHFIRFIECEFDHAGQELLKIGGNSSYITIVGCDFHHSGLRRSGRPAYAEGIYIGNGATLQDQPHDIIVMANRFHSIGNENQGGEAIDIKRCSHRISVINNYIENVVVHSGGAITALIDPSDYPEGATNPQILIAGNEIRGVRALSTGWTGAGICLGANGIQVIGNTVSDTEGPALLVYTNAANTTGNTLFTNNQVDGEVLINTYGLRGSQSPVSVGTVNDLTIQDSLGYERY